MDPFTWACHEPNIDSFMLFVRLKQLPKVPTFCEAVAQQRRIVEEEAAATASQRALADRLTIQLPVASTAVSYSMFDDAEGDDWQLEMGDWWQQDVEPPTVPTEEASEAVDS